MRVKAAPVDETVMRYAPGFASLIRATADLSQGYRKFNL
jgi:hypothetical protein